MAIHKLKLKQLDINAYVEGLVSAEQARAEAAEANINAALVSEASTRAAADTALQGNIDSEEAARIAADSAEATRATGEEARIEGLVTTEAARAVSEEGRIEGKVDQEVTDRIAAVSAEQVARVAGDSSLQTQIDFITSNTDAGAIDSLTEIVAAFQNADGSLQTSITNLSNTASADRAAIRSEFAAADAVLQGELDAEEALRASEITRVEGLVSAEEVARLAEVDAEEDKRLAEDTKLLDYVSGHGIEKAYRPGSSADFVLNGAVKEFAPPMPSGKQLSGHYGAPEMYLNGQKMMAAADLASVGSAGEYFWDGAKFNMTPDICEAGDMLCFHFGVRDPMAGLTK
jgi:hypothetical protein